MLLKPLPHRVIAELAKRSLHRRLQFTTATTPSCSTTMTWPSSPSPTPKDTPEPVIKPVFDIFDAPVRLGESRQFIQRHLQKRRESTANAPKLPSSESQQHPHPSPSAASLPTSTPRDMTRPPVPSLPAPVMFDGPAMPRRTVSLRHEHKSRRLHDFSYRKHHHHTPAEYRTSLSDASYSIQLFDGPANTSRHRYSHRPTPKKYNPLLVGIMTLAATCLGFGVSAVTF